MSKLVKNEELEVMTVKELLVVAKELQIVGRHDMKKAELISAISKAQAEFEYAAKIVKDDEVAACSKCEEELDTCVACSKNTNCNLTAMDEATPTPKTNYVENARIGTIVAFKVNDSKVLSGMIIEIHRDQFVVETKTKVKFTVKKKNIIWVKTGARWPRGVYEALKGGSLVEDKANNYRSFAIAEGIGGFNCKNQSL